MNPTPDRVVIVTDSSVVRGGATFLAMSLAERLSAEGQEVTYIAGDGGGTTTSEGCDAGFSRDFDLVALGGRRLMETSAGEAVTRGLYNRASARALRIWIANNDTAGTIYHLHNWSLILSPSVFNALAPVADRTIVHAHDFFLACPNGAYFDYPRQEVCRLTPLSAACLTKNCDKRAFSHKLWRSARHGILVGALRPFQKRAHFVLINAAMHSWLERAISPRSVSAIQNPVQAFGQLNVEPERQNRIAFIGQVQKLKGVFDIAEAGRRLGIAIDFFGDGDARVELMRRYPEHVYHGWMRRQDIGAQLSTVRACVVATQSPEPFCMAAFEAVATGLPLVVSDSILASDELVSSGAALSYRSADLRALTGVLQALTLDDDLVARLGRAARAAAPTVAKPVDRWVEEHRQLYANRLALSQGHFPESAEGIAAQ